MRLSIEFAKGDWVGLDTKKLELEAVLGYREPISWDIEKKMNELLDQIYHEIGLNLRIVGKIKEDSRKTRNPATADPTCLYDAAACVSGKIKAIKTT